MYHESLTAGCFLLKTFPRVGHGLSHAIYSHVSVERFRKPPMIFIEVDHQR
jgi:hypothetical protein